MWGSMLGSSNVSKLYFVSHRELIAIGSVPSPWRRSSRVHLLSFNSPRSVPYPHFPNCTSDIATKRIDAQPIAANVGGLETDSRSTIIYATCSSYVYQQFIRLTTEANSNGNVK